MKKFYDSDANSDVFRNERVAIIGYGIQGRSQALNLRDSGADVVIGNIRDHYYERIEKDGFRSVPLKDIAKNVTLIMLLIPDQAQKEIFDSYIVPHIQEGSLLVVAHGYSLYFKQLSVPENIDVALLAPRMPGIPIREKYLEGSGVPAFVDIYKDATGNAWERVLALGKGLGFTRAGMMHVTVEEETEIDLFIEQFYLPLVIHSARLSFDLLVKEGFSPESTLMELYASGELGELLLLSAKKGIYEVWKDQASPTCQYGIARALHKGFPKDALEDYAKKVIEEIRNKSFLKDLMEEADKGYSKLNKYNELNSDSLLAKTQKKVSEFLHSC